jgi:hypothetical protein
LAQLPNLSREFSSAQVLIRFCLRMSILVIFAAFGSVDFGRSLGALLWMSVILSALIGAVKREPPFGGMLNYWDEAAAYAAAFSLVSVFNHTVPA